MAQTKVKLISDGVIVQGNLHSSHGITTAHIGEGSNLYYTDARVGSYLSTNSFATESYVGTQITNLVDSSPATLNTLNELAAALGDDPNFATTTANSIGLKAPLASPSFTGNATFAGSVTINNNTPLIVNGTDPLISFQNSATNHWQVGLENTNSDRFVFYDNNAAAYQLILNSTSGNATFAGILTVQGAGAASYGSLSLVSSDSFIRLNTTGGTTDKQKWDIRTVSASGYEALDFRTANDANNSFSTKLSIAHGGAATFAGEIRTANRLAIKETYFGYSSGYKVIQVGESAATKSISLGYDPSGNTSGSFSGNEILIPNNIRILAPAANNSGYYGLMMLNSSNKVLLGSSNYLMESNYIMALDPATKNVGIGTTSPLAKLDLGPAGGIKQYVYSDGGNVRAGFGVDLSGSSRELSIFHSSSNSVNGNISFGYRYEPTGTYYERMRITGGGDVLINATSKFNGYPTTFKTQTLASGAGDYCPILELVGNRSAASGNQNAMIQFFNKTSTAVEVGRISSIQGSATNSGVLTFATANAGTLTERMRIKSDGGVKFYPSAGSQGLSMNDTNQVMNSGYINGDQTISLTFTCTTMSSMFIECVFNHYGYITSYGCSRIATFAVGPVIQINNIQEITTNNGGSWTFNRVSNGEFTVAKTAGAYGGGGRWYVKINGANVYAS